jgi:hypothetical protein
MPKQNERKLANFGTKGLQRRFFGVMIRMIVGAMGLEKVSQGRSGRSAGCIQEGDREQVYLLRLDEKRVPLRNEVSVEPVSVRAFEALGKPALERKSVCSRLLACSWWSKDRNDVFGQAAG